MGRRKQPAQPDIPVTVIDEPVEPEIADLAVTRFIHQFVVKTKRDRALLLFGRTKRGREGLLQQLPEWIDANFTTELVGDTGFGTTWRSASAPSLVCCSCPTISAASPSDSRLASRPAARVCSLRNEATSHFCSESSVRLPCAGRQPSSRSARRAADWSYRRLRAPAKRFADHVSER